jgi:hypothetical protein
MIQKHKIPYHLIADFDSSISDLSARLVSDFELRILNELSRSKLRGIEGPSFRPIPTPSPPNVFIGGPAPEAPGFPLKACGNDGHWIGD